MLAEQLDEAREPKQVDVQTSVLKHLKGRPMALDDLTRRVSADVGGSVPKDRFKLYVDLLVTQGKAQKSWRKPGHYMLRDSKEWPGFERVGGRLSGSMPASFKVLKASVGHGSPKFSAMDVGDTFVGKEGRHGSVKYEPRGGGLRAGRWMDRDDVLAAVHSHKTIEPHGRYGR